MKRLLLVGSLLLVLVLVIGVLDPAGWWSESRSPSRFDGPVARLGLSLDLGTDPRTPLILLASVTSPRAQAALNAREPLGQEFGVGSASAGWWESLELERRSGEGWKIVSFEVVRPIQTHHLDLAAGESGSAFIALPAMEAGEGRQLFRIRLEVAGSEQTSAPLEVERLPLADEVLFALEQAEITTRRGDPKRALTLLDELGTAGDSLPGHVLRARAHEDLGELEAALEQWELALAAKTFESEPPSALIVAIERVHRKMGARAP